MHTLCCNYLARLLLKWFCMWKYQQTHTHRNLRLKKKPHTHKYTQPNRRHKRLKSDSLRLYTTLLHKFRKRTHTQANTHTHSHTAITLLICMCPRLIRQTNRERRASCISNNLGLCFISPDVEDLLTPVWRKILVFAAKLKIRPEDKVLTWRHSWEMWHKQKLTFSCPCGLQDEFLNLKSSLKMYIPNMQKYYSWLVKVTHASNVARNADGDEHRGPQSCATGIVSSKSVQSQTPVRFHLRGGCRQILHT